MKALVTADWHLRIDRPRCRLDSDWLGFQTECIHSVVEIANSNKVPIIIVGDLFDACNVPSIIIVTFLKEMNRAKYGYYLLAGNHDLPYHSPENLSRSSIGVLLSMAEYSGITIKTIEWPDVRWRNFGDMWNGPENADIVFDHRLVFEKAKDLPPNVNAPTAQEMLSEFPDAKWIFVGDMHRAFVYEKKGRYVINPGCLNRQSADFIDYTPVVMLVNTESSKVSLVEIGDSGPMVTDSYLKTEKERENRLDAFVESIKKDDNFTLSFVANIERAISMNKKSLKPGTLKTIHRLIEEE